MSVSVAGTQIDAVLHEAVDNGQVPHVAAIAADRDAGRGCGSQGSPTIRSRRRRSSRSCALLRGGELDGDRILSEQTVDAAFSNQIGELDFPASIPTADPPITDDFNAGPGWKWGHGLLLNAEDVAGGRKAGSGAWAGLFNTHFFIDDRDLRLDLHRQPAVRQPR